MAGEEPVDTQELVKEHDSALRAFVSARMSHLVSARESVSDVVQSTWRELLRQRNRLQYRGPAALRGFLLKLARRKLSHRLRYHRARRRDVRREAAEPDSRWPADAMPDHAVQIEMEDAVSRLLARLSPGDRAVVVMARLQRLPHLEIARRLQMSPEATRVRLSRALARLADEVSRRRDPITGGDVRRPG